MQWQPMETAPKDGTPILAWCIDSADKIFDDEANMLTPYGCHVEDGCYPVENGANVVSWVDGETNYYLGVEEFIPGWWFLHGTPPSREAIVANPVAWMPIPEYKETRCIMDIHYDRSQGWMWLQGFQCQELADRNTPFFDIRINLDKYTDEELLDIITSRLNDIRDTYYSNKRLREVDD